MSEQDDIVKDFLVESYENLDMMDRDLVSLEKNPGDNGIISRIFRAIHTIKGTSGFFGFSKLEKVTHIGESLLSKLRDGKLVISQPIASALLKLVDAVRKILQNIENGGKEGDENYADLIAELSRLTEESQAAPTDPSLAPSTPPALSLTPETKTAAEVPTAIRPAPEAPAPSLGEILIQTGVAKPNQLAAALTQQLEGDSRRVGEILVEHGAVKSQDIKEALETQKVQGGTAVADTTIRVDVSLLDKLMNLVGELVLSRNQILQLRSLQENSALSAASQRLNLVTSELQESVMKTRMQPIGNIWSKFPRVVRDLSASCGKKISLEMEGKETELDKTIIESIKDPLTHIIRNSVDHGIETPESRRAAGKPEEGRIFMRAYHEGGQVIIEIVDNGGGIDPDRVKNKALEKGLITLDKAREMSVQEAVGLIFLPGFSTAEKITNVSGRGVGMDVVKTNIERIGGTVDIQSVKGSGTTIKIKIPLTLAIIPVLMVVCDGDHYAIPQVSLLELVRLEGEKARKGIERVQGVPVYRLRGKLLPIAFLRHELALPAQEMKEADCINIVVLQADDHSFGLVVDGVLDTEEIVVKPLGKQLKGINVFAGATILGDGNVALILDVLGLALASNVVSKSRSQALAEASQASSAAVEEIHPLLVFSVGDDGRMAIPLTQVSRLEELQSSTLERIGGLDVIQYRGQILPLFPIQKLLTERRKTARKIATETALIKVIVHQWEGHSFGLIVDQIVDILSCPIKILHPATRPGVKGSLVIQGRVTELADIEFMRKTALEHSRSLQMAGSQA